MNSNVEKIELRLFYRAGSPSSEAAMAALREYLKLHIESGFEVEFVNLDAKPKRGTTQRYVAILPTLSVRVDGAAKLLVKGLSPFATLQETLDKLLAEA